METAVVFEVLKQGLLGAICIIQGIVIYRLYQRVGTLQDARIEDVRKHQTELVEITRENVAALTNSTNAILAVRESVTELKETFAEYHDSLRSYLEDRRTRSGR